MLIVFAVPFWTIRTFFMFGFHTRLARREIWLRVMLILCPVFTDLLQISHFANVNASLKIT
jgi:hypothetical protein